MTTLPPVRELAAGVHRITLPLPWRVDFTPFSPSSVNVYVLQQGDRLVLVDSGIDNAEGREGIRAGLRHLGWDVSQLTDLVVTHFHADHVGLLDALADAAPRARIHVHPADAALVRARHRDPAAAAADLSAWLSLHGMPSGGDVGAQPSRPPAGAASITGSRCAAWDDETGTVLDVGDQVWRLLWTPGHTPGHLVLFDAANGLLLSGDHLMASTTANVSKHPASSRNPIADYRSSLALVSGLGARQVWPGHGASFDDLDRRIRRVIAQQDRKLERLTDALADGPASGYDLAQRLWARGRDFMSPDSRRLALTETLALLTYLESESRVISRSDHAGRVTYAVTAEG